MIRRNRWAWIATPLGLGVIVAVFVLALIALGIFAIWAWSWSADFNHEIAAETMVLTAGTFVIAIIAGLIAIAAFGVAIQKPRLQIDVFVPDARVAIVYDRDRGPHAQRVQWVKFEVHVRLWNRNSYSGRNPAVRLEFRGFDSFSPDEGANNGKWVWTRPPGSSLYDSWVYQWDGGADLSIHGPNWFRDLPVFYVSDSSIRPGTKPTLVVTAVVDGDSKNSEPKDLSSYTRESSPKPPRPGRQLEEAPPHTGPWRDT